MNTEAQHSNHTYESSFVPCKDDGTQSLGEFEHHDASKEIVFEPASFYDEFGFSTNCDLEHKVSDNHDGRGNIPVLIPVGNIGNDDLFTAADLSTSNSRLPDNDKFHSFEIQSSFVKTYVNNGNNQVASENVNQSVSDYDSVLTVESRCIDSNRRNNLQMKGTEVHKIFKKPGTKSNNNPESILNPEEGINASVEQAGVFCSSTSGSKLSDEARLQLNSLTQKLNTLMKNYGCEVVVYGNIPLAKTVFVQAVGETALKYMKSTNGNQAFRNWTDYTCSNERECTLTSVADKNGNIIHTVVSSSKRRKLSKPRKVKTSKYAKRNHWVVNSDYSTRVAGRCPSNADEIEILFTDKPETVGNETEHLQYNICNNNQNPTCTESTFDDTLAMESYDGASKLENIELNVPSTDSNAEKLTHDSGLDKFCKFKCEKCNYATRFKKNLQEHEQIHLKPSLKCDICEVSFIEKSELDFHIKRNHQCLNCNKKFVKFADLQKHMEVHKIEKLICKICDKRFTRPDSLDRHLITHADVKPYSCEYCPRTFTRLDTLRKHQVTHSNTRPFICDVCGKRLSRPDYLIAHKRIHTGEKDFMCELCGKMFYSVMDVKKHAKKCTGIKRHSEKKLVKRFRKPGFDYKPKPVHESNLNYAAKLPTNVVEGQDEFISMFHVQDVTSLAVPISDTLIDSAHSQNSALFNIPDQFQATYSESCGYGQEGSSTHLFGNPEAQDYRYATFYQSFDQQNW